MRKFAVFMCAAFATMAASAASIGWGGIVPSGGTTFGTGMGYVFNVTESGLTVEAVTASILNGTFDSSTSAGSGSTSNGTFQMGLSYPQFQGTAGDSVFLVIFDALTVEAASNFTIGSVKTTGAGGGMPPMVTPGVTWNSASDFASWQAVPIPEPTSLALLALGVAAVGLRRKVK